MSDDIVFTEEERLEGARRGLLKNSIYFWIGWTVFAISLLGISYLFLRSGAKWPDILAFLGWVIIGLPKIKAVIFSGLWSAISGPLKPDYEVVTYRDGVRVSSDGGAQSIQLNFIVKLIQIGLLLILGGILTIVHMVYLSIKNIVLYLKATTKPVFIKSGIFIIVINLAVFIGATVLALTIQQAGTAVINAQIESEYDKKTSDGFTFMLNETKDARHIWEFSGKSGAVVIPGEFNGMPVVAIYEAFYGNTSITSAVVSENVIYLQEAFEECKGLKQVTLPRSLKYIGYATFKESGITSIVIPEGVTDIGNNAFQNCTNLTSVTLPRSLERIGVDAFVDCTSLTDVRIPSGSTITYGEYAGYIGSRAGIEVEKALSDFSRLPYFAEGQQQTVTGYSSFKGCTGLSADSRQTIRDSGYEGEF